MSKRDDNPFLEEFGDVKPISQDKVPLKRNSPDNVAIEIRKKAAISHGRKDLNYLTDAPVPSVDPLEVLEYKLDGVQTGVYKKLRQGKYTIDGHLDLHRHTVAEARSALFQFIQQSLKLDCRTVLVTHGKGMRSDPPARIKSYVNYWLKQIPEVLAFHSAKKNQGGTGSVYVLLRKSADKRIENKERYQ
ncbi:DNA endonuclease SmrA [Pleionea sediminis]|uniref:DNA endonuclease SmrA n=1 Tax=Pleionea sediminis TaxID=2569479 RepID=UPI001184B0DB|nr:DNA endonuclease SmrA [Pleionea sediminis]